MTDSEPSMLIRAEITGEWNARALRNVAEAFGLGYSPLRGDEPDDLLECFDWIAAAENRPGARPIYAVRAPKGVRTAVLLGNEAKGLRLRTLKRANAVVEIPLPSRNVNCLNVAAAAAIVAYYLTLPIPLRFPQRTATAVRSNRPGLLLAGGEDAMELGSVLRSACAFGWERVLLYDRGSAWYACDRSTKSEGRGAARRGRNPIRVVPYSGDPITGYRNVILCTTARGGRPVHEARVVGAEALIVLADESAGSWIPPTAPGVQTWHVSLPPIPSECYHFRQAASIALAEIARQLGRPGGDGIYLRGRKERFRSEVTCAPRDDAWAVSLEDLERFT